MKIELSDDGLLIECDDADEARSLADDLYCCAEEPGHDIVADLLGPDGVMPMVVRVRA